MPADSNPVIRVVLLAAAVLLAGCASTPKTEPMPTIIKVPVTQYVPVPEALTAPCPVTRAKTRTVEAVVLAYNANVTALEDCSDRMGRIRGLTP